jgi:hypothetical protein
LLNPFLQGFLPPHIFHLALHETEGYVPPYALHSLRLSRAAFVFEFLKMGGPAAMEPLNLLHKVFLVFGYVQPYPQTIFALAWGGHGFLSKPRDVQMLLASQYLYGGYPKNGSLTL